MLLFFPLAALAGDEEHAAGRPAGNNILLSAELRNLLGEEMVAIENGMKNLVPAISSGEWEKVASIAQNISNSFIMKQKLTTAQKDELHRALPGHFIEMDQDFHNSAGMLAHAAGMKNADVVNFYFFKMNSACVACHTKYATKRFPGLLKGNEGDSHNH
jgi:hypothetical protein